MNPTPPDIPDELISAYLDGELSPEEKARVEDLLIDSRGDHDTDRDFHLLCMRR